MNRYFEMLIHYVISGGQVPRKESRIFTLLALIAGFLMGYVVIFFGYSSYVVIIGGCGLFVLITSIAIWVYRYCENKKTKHNNISERNHWIYRSKR